MLLVAKVAAFVCDSWKGPKINKDLVLKGALLHDLGNIVKFDFDAYGYLLGEEKKRLNYWKEVQREMRSKYGRNDHQATQKILEELGVDQRLKEEILGRSFENAEVIVKNASWELKIFLYADFRASPFGITSTKERLKEFAKRYSHRRDLDAQELIRAGEFLEKQIQENTKANLDIVKSEDIAVDNDELLNIAV